MSGRKVFPYLLLVVGSACFVMPLLIMLLTSVKPSGEVMAIPPRLLPSELRWDNYSEAFKIVDFKRHYLNSIFVVSCCVVGNVLTAALCAFGFARPSLLATITAHLNADVLVALCLEFAHVLHHLLRVATIGMTIDRGALPALAPQQIVDQHIG